MDISHLLIECAVLKVSKDSDWRMSESKKYLEFIIKELKSQYVYIHKDEEFWDLIEMAVMERLLQVNTADASRLLGYYEMAITEITEDVFITLPFDFIKMAFNREKLKAMIIDQFNKRRG